MIVRAVLEHARGEVVALRWRDVDFAGHALRVRANFSHGELVTPRSGKVRTVPMVPEVAQRLTRLREREHFHRRGRSSLPRPGG
jgi:integrase